MFEHDEKCKDWLPKHFAVLAVFLGIALGIFGLSRLVTINRAKHFEQVAVDLDVDPFDLDASVRDKTARCTQRCEAFKNALVDAGAYTLTPRYDPNVCRCKALVVRESAPEWEWSESSWGVGLLAVGLAFLGSAFAKRMEK